MAATIWRGETEHAVRSGNVLGRHRYIEVRYEELVGNSGAVIREVADFAALPWSSTFETRLRTFDVRAAAASRPTSLQPDQIAAITHIVEPLARHLGYSDSATAQP